MDVLSLCKGAVPSQRRVSRAKICRSDPLVSSCPSYNMYLPINGKLIDPFHLKSIASLHFPNIRALLEVAASRQVEMIL